MGSLCSCDFEGVLSSDDDPCGAEFQSMLANEISEKIQEIEGKYGSAPPLPGTTANTNNKPNGNVLAAPPGFQFPRGPVPRIPIPGSIVSIPPGVAGGIMGGQGHLAGMQSMGGASMPMNPQMMGMGAMGKWMPNVNMPGAMGKGGMPMPMMQMKRSGMPNQHAASYEPPTSAGSPGSITSVSSAPTRTSRDIGLRQTYAPSLLQKSVQEVEEREISFKGSRGGMQELRKLQEEAQQWQQENLKISEEIQSRKEEADRQSAICKELHESQEEAERQKVAWQEDARKAREDADRISLRNAEDFRRAQLEAEQQLALATRQAEELDECRVQTNQLLSAEAILLTEKSQILQDSCSSSPTTSGGSPRQQSASYSAQEASSVSSTPLKHGEHVEAKEVRRIEALKALEVRVSGSSWSYSWATGPPVNPAWIEEAEASRPRFVEFEDSDSDLEEVDLIAVQKARDEVIGLFIEKPHIISQHFLPSLFRSGAGNRSVSPVRGRSLSTDPYEDRIKLGYRAASLRRAERPWPR